MTTTKMNFTILKEVAERLFSHVPAGQRSAFVSDSIGKKIDAIEEERLHEELIAGYTVRAKEDAQINREWDLISV